MKKLYHLIVGMTVICLFAFTFRPFLNSSFQPKINGNNLFWSDPNLYPLYLEGPAKDNFLGLLKQIKASNQKIVFQFFYQKNGILTLALYTGGKNSQGYDQTIDFKLKPYKHCPQINIDNLDVGVYLGDMEFDQTTNLDALINVVATNNIIVFMPALYPVPSTKKNAIEYMICTADDESGICNSNQIKSNTGITTNPSPPHGGN